MTTAREIQHHRRMAFLLSLCLGLFGAHRFYLHEPLRGLGYLAFSWTLVPLVLALVDAAFLYRMSDDEFFEEYAQLQQQPARAR